MPGWSIANRIRSERKLCRRAPFLAAIGSGIDPKVARGLYGIPTRTANRYRKEAGI